jgi:hypothetical protein
MDIQHDELVRLNKDADRAELLSEMRRVARRLQWAIEEELAELLPSLEKLADAGWPEPDDVLERQGPPRGMWARDDDAGAK